MPFISFTMATYLNVSIELLGNLLMEFPRKRGFYGLRTELQRICHHFQSAVRRNASPRHWYAFLQGNVRLWYSLQFHPVPVYTELPHEDSHWSRRRWCQKGRTLDEISINDDTFNRIMDFMPELYKLKDKCICRQIKYCKTPEECGEGKDPFGNWKGLRACKGSFFVCIDKNDHCVRTPRRSEFPFLPKWQQKWKRLSFWRGSLFHYVIPL